MHICIYAYMRNMHICYECSYFPCTINNFQDFSRLPVIPKNITIPHYQNHRFLQKLYSLLDAEAQQHQFHTGSYQPVLPKVKCAVAILFSGMTLEISTVVEIIKNLMKRVEIIRYFHRSTHGDISINENFLLFQLRFHR